ncbi:hypothetical protein DFH08DRAFT_805416 [Mycena albidolilacea]|uniref:Uncharacterized protein n=1 Tax=Mycena albidolilacea TaxID=1033008 RepID=A0AAD7A8G1_9AGAR|nr:hypothetical protein DFH08DRAFT_805416 [Mycena albidolilacea]
MPPRCDPGSGASQISGSASSHASKALGKVKKAAKKVATAIEKAFECQCKKSRTSKAQATIKMLTTSNPYGFENPRRQHLLPPPSTKVPFFPSQASTSSNVQNHPDTGVLPEYNGHILYSPSVNSSMFNAAHVLEPTANVHQPHSAHTIGSDSALTYLPGCRAIISQVPVAPMQLKLQDVPATEPSEGIKILSLASILAEHQCAPTCPGYNAIFVFHWLKWPWTVKHNLGLSSHFFEVVFDNSPWDDGPGIVSTYNLNRHFEFVTIGDGPTIELMYGNSTGHSICRTSRLADFVSHFVHLNIRQLNSIARVHTVQPVNFDTNKPALIQSQMCHLYPREGQFSLHSVSEEMQAEGSPSVSMSDLEVLPILMDNHMQVDEGDSRDHVSMYLLNASFNFVEILSPTTL